MRKYVSLLLILAVVFLCSSCSSENAMNLFTGNSNTDKSASSAVTEQPSVSSDMPLQDEKSETESLPEDQRNQEMLISKGGAFVKYGSFAAFLPDQGGIAIADLDNGVYSYISGQSASTLYFDGSTVYCISDSGIFSIGSDGQSVMISEDITYSLWLENDKIYYIKQTDFSINEPYGELWCMNTDGTNAIVILPTEIKGDFYIKNGWIYYTDTAGTGIYRIMLFGNAPVQLVAGQLQICLVTDYAIYYKDIAGLQSLRRVDLETGANVFLGAYGSILEIGDEIYVMARRERSWGLDNLFSLALINDKNTDITYPITFENIGEDQFCYYWNNYIYLRKSTGEIYRINISDSNQEKESVSAYSTVLIDGKGYYLEGRSLMVYDCESSQLSAIKQKKQ